MKLGTYELVEEIGRGGMSVVYRARSTNGTEVAVKVLLGTGTGDALARFEREVAILKTLASTCAIVPILDAGNDGGRTFLVMPLLTGDTLAARIRRGAIPVDEALELVRGLATTLGHAHAAGIVHRDVKPSNVLFDGAGRAFLADFGLAKVFREDGVNSFSRSGMIAGTLGYAAPEQVEDAKRAGPPADVFALGVVLFECLSCRLPFASEGVLTYATALAEGRRANLRALAPHVPAWVEGFLDRALAADPNERFQEGHEAAGALAGGGRSPTRRAGAIVALGLLVVLGLVAKRALAPEHAAPAPPPTVTSPTPVVSVPSKPVADPLADATAALATGDLVKAEKAATSAVELEPRSAKALALRGSIRALRTKGAPALADAQRALELDSRLPLAWTASAMARFNQEDHGRAMGDADRAIALGERARAMIVRACALSSLDRDEEAREEIARAVHADPGLASAWNTSGGLRAYRQDPDGALADLERATALSPLLATAHYHRSYALGLKDDLEGALRSVNRAIELDPELQSAWQQRGFVRVRLKQDDLAVKDFERSTTLEPAAVLSWVGLAGALARQGHVGEASEAVDRALIARPGFPAALQLKQRLREWAEQKR